MGISIISLPNIIVLYIIQVIVNAGGPVSRIIGGRTAQPSSAPFIVSIHRVTISGTSKKSIHYCGGSLINEQWIITAAHCIRGNTKTEYTMVHAGQHNMKALTKSLQKRKVDYMKRHEKYRGVMSPYDIALIHTNKPFFWDKMVQPIRLPSLDEIFHNYGKVTLFGWGRTRKAKGRNLPNVLRTVSVPVIPLHTCQRIFGGPFRTPIYKTNICTGPIAGGKGPCFADSGGPVVRKNKLGDYILVGVISWGPDICGIPQHPSVHVQTYPFMDWIAKIKAMFECQRFKESLCKFKNFL